MISVSGVLKGYDPLVNLVLDEGVEVLRGTIPRYSVTSPQNRHTRNPSFPPSPRIL